MTRRCLSAVLALLVLSLAGFVSLAPPASASPSPSPEALYVRPIAIVEQSGSDLYNYTVRIVLNSTNFDSWEKLGTEDGSDIYFEDAEGNLLYHWIEYFNMTEKKAIIWVRVPQIPASGTTKIYMYYGGREAPIKSNQFLVGIAQLREHKYHASYDPVVTFSKPTASTLRMHSTDGSICDAYVFWVVPRDWLHDKYLRFHWSASTEANVAFPHRLLIYDGVYMRNNDSDFPSGAGIPKKGAGLLVSLEVDDSFDRVDEVYVNLTSAQCEYVTVFINLHDSDSGIYDDLDLDWIEVNTGSGGAGTVAREEFDNEIVMEVTGTVGDYGLYRTYVDPEPKVVIGHEEPVERVELPLETMYLVHELAYSPNSTQFSHSFSAANTTTAGYETAYADAYGWRVYADPYQSGGASYENSASLVSEVNITLPYSSVLVENVTLVAKTNGTGSLRQLWIRVLNSTGGVVAELSNATIGTDWTEVVLVVGTDLSKQVTIWINATAKSTTAVGEEIAVKDVRVYVEHETNPKTIVPWSSNVEFFNCSAEHYVELGSSEYLNSTAIAFKLIQYLSYNTTDYPVQPSYVGEETIGSYNYSVYRIEPANYSQYLVVYALLENYIKTVTIKFARTGAATGTALLYEEVVIEPENLANVTVKTPTGESMNFTEVSSVVFKPRSTGDYSIEAKWKKPSEYKIGCATTSLTVSLGKVTVELEDAEGRLLSYAPATVRIVNETSGAVYAEESGRGRFSFDLPACNFTFTVLYQGMLVGSTSLELNSTTTGSALVLRVAALERIEHYANRWSVEPNATVAGAVSLDLTRVDPYTVEDEFSDLALRFTWNDVQLNIGGTVVSVVNGTPITSYTNRIMVLYPAQWGYVILLWREEGFVAIAVSHAWGENILITAVNGTFAVPKSILDYLPLHWAVETDGIETETDWVIPPGKHVHIWNTRYTKGSVEGLCFSNVPPYGHVEGMTVLLNFTETDVGQVYYVGTGIGADRVFYTTRDYVAITAFEDDWYKDTKVFTLFGFKTRYAERKGYDVKEIFHINAPAMYISPLYLDDPNAGTWKAMPETLVLVLYETESGYGLAARLETFTTVPKEERYDAWLFEEFEIDETAKTVEVLVGFVARPTTDIRNYQSSGATHAFDIRTWLGTPNIDFSVKEKYDGLWSALASGDPYNYQNGYWAVYGEKTIDGTTYRCMMWLDKVFLGDKTSLTPQAWALYGQEIGVQISEFDTTLSAGVEYGWTARRIVTATEAIKQDVPSPTTSTDTTIVKGKIGLGEPYPEIEYKPRMVVSDRPFNLTDLNPKLPLSRIAIETEPGAKLILNYSSHPPTSLIVEGGKLLSYSGGIAVIEAEADRVDVMDAYRVSLLVKDRLGNLLSNFVVYINNTAYKTQAGRVEDLLPVEDYVLEFPDQKGFKFYAFTDGFNESTRAISLWRDYSFAVEYRVPTSLEVAAKRVSISSWLAEQEDTVEVYFEGYLKDYYGDPVAGRRVNVAVYADGYAICVLSAVTDVSGYYRTGTVELPRGREYRVVVSFAGDDTYVEESSETVLLVEALPPAPVEVVGIPAEYLIALAAVAIGVAVAVYAWRAARHAVEEELERRAKFVKRKRRYK